jgi:HAD superfamily hydrolase (TIGR01548 family)
LEYLLENKVWFQKKIKHLLAQFNLLILDIDGVIVDVTKSFRKVISLTVQHVIETFVGRELPHQLITYSDTQLFKQHSGFNNDWELTYAAVLFYWPLIRRKKLKQAKEIETWHSQLPNWLTEVERQGGGVEGAWKVFTQFVPDEKGRGTISFDFVKQIFQEYYGGVDWCERLYGFKPKYIKVRGLINQEKILLDREALSPFLPNIGVITGRIKEEAEVALQRAGLEKHIHTSCLIYDDGTGQKKPDPSLLKKLLSQKPNLKAVYLGDTMDDWHMVKNYSKISSKGQVWGAMVVKDQGEAELFKSQGAHVIGFSPREITSFLERLKEIERKKN